MDIKIASTDSVIIYFGDSISKEISHKVKSAYLHLNSLNNSAIIELIPSYTSLFITYDIFKYDFESIKRYLNEELSKDIDKEQSEVKLITIDVYYGSEVGLDLERVAKLHDLSIDEVIDIHSSKIYDVYTIGFLPGFAYLGEVDKKIQTSRLESPRKKIPKNSVAIADAQTSVYPIDSPGGWNILGKTAFNLFDKSHAKLSPIDINTQIKFNPISKEEFIKQGGEI
jgi:inhibitor of KinA